jgi:Subtilase family
MADFEHLPLVRLPRLEAHRKVSNPTPPPKRDRGTHAAKVTAGLDAAIAAETRRERIVGIDPGLILRVTMTDQMAEDDWRRAGFKVLAQDEGKVLILFTSDAELTEFKIRLARFKDDPLTVKGNPPHNGLFANIEAVAAISPEDRLGPRLRTNGAADVAAINWRKSWTVDVEIWDAATPEERQTRVHAIESFIMMAGGNVLSRYIGDTGLIVLRIKVRGTLLRRLCHVAEIALIDSPPTPDLETAPLSKLTIASTGPVTAPPDDAPMIGVVDSGISANPLLAQAIIDSFGVPAELGDADVHGHGTRVAGVAIYGDVSERIAERSFAAPFRLLSVRVVNDQGRFDDASSIADQMQKAIKALYAKGCRIINISLGDAAKIPYADGRVTAWASTLDYFARTLDVLIVVSAGNSQGAPSAPWGSKPDGVVTLYPSYLFEPTNRIIDPAMAACILTVGSVAHSNGLRDDPYDGADIRPITARDHPTPITRTGPGTGGAVKPELVDYGGTAVFNGGTQRLMTGANWDSAGIVTLRANYLEGLFEASTGTSMAAPRVAFKAALLLRRFPDASANLLRALLATCAEVPESTVKLLNGVADKSVSRCCGYGIPDVERALFSQEKRVIRYADRDNLEIDQFALYEVPIPDDFRRVKGDRQIRVTLAFDPPVRHTRLEYLGVRMSFRLIRGLTPEEIFEHYRKREEGDDWPDLPEKHKCKLTPGYKARSVGTLQSATFRMKKNVDHYGDTYYLAVFADRRWAGENVSQQRYAAVVELLHPGEVRLYQQSRQRVRLRS